jgi:small subunit ribosomal protein S7
MYKKTLPHTRVEKFTNVLMTRGKKSVARRIVHDAMERVRETTKRPPEETFNKALDNVSPLVEVRAKRIGGTNYQVPIEVSPKRRESLAMRWIIQAARGKSGMHMAEALARELIDAAKAAGSAMKKKEDVHRMAQANKAFAHFA